MTELAEIESAISSATDLWKSIVGQRNYAPVQVILEIDAQNLSLLCAL